MGINPHVVNVLCLLGAQHEEFGRLVRWPSFGPPAAFAGGLTCSTSNSEWSGLPTTETEAIQVGQWLESQKFLERLRHQRHGLRRLLIIVRGAEAAAAVAVKDGLLEQPATLLLRKKPSGDTVQALAVGGGHPKQAGRRAFRRLPRGLRFGGGTRGGDNTATCIIGIIRWEGQRLVIIYLECKLQSRGSTLDVRFWRLKSIPHFVVWTWKAGICHFTTRGQVGPP